MHRAINGIGQLLIIIANYDQCQVGMLAIRS